MSRLTEFHAFKATSIGIRLEPEDHWNYLSIFTQFDPQAECRTFQRGGSAIELFKTFIEERALSLPEGKSRGKACLLAGKLYTDLGYLRQFLKHLVSLAMLASLVWLACFLVRYCPAVAFFLCAVLSLVISLRPLSFYFVLALLIGIAPCKRL